MKILIVGSDKIYSIENFYVKYLKELGVEITLFTAQNFFYDYYQRSILHKILFKASLSGIIPRINRLFRESVTAFKPDIVWVFKGMEISPESIKWAKKQDVRLVNYNPDNPFIFSGRGSGNKYVTQAIPLYDLHFTYNLEVQRMLEGKFHLLTGFLPFGFDLSDELFKTISGQDEILKLCFAGNPDKERAEFIMNLAKAGIAVDLFGNHWEKFVNHEQIKIYPPVYGIEFWKVLSRYRVQLNLMRIHNELSHNMRSFEVPAAGGIMLAPDTPEHRIFFEDRKEIYLFKDWIDAVRLAKMILELPAVEAQQIRQNARRRSLESGYSYKKRSENVYHVLKTSFS